MRPFLSFSIPLTGDRVKEYLRDQTYDQVDWLQLTNMIHDHATIGLGSSKFAAKRVNASFSLFNKERTIPVTQSTYGCVSLGVDLSSRLVWFGQCNGAGIGGPVRDVAHCKA